MALIPPVSGGDFRLTEAPLSLDAAVREVARDEAGAVATFLGTVRNRSRERTVLYLEYEAYEGMAEDVMAQLAAELATGTSSPRSRSTTGSAGSRSASRASSSPSPRRTAPPR